MTTNMITATLLRQSLTEWMDDSRKSIDYVSGQLGIPTDRLRLWLNGSRLDMVEMCVNRFLAMNPVEPRPKPDRTRKYCTRCGLTLPVESFAPVGNGNLRSWCRNCANEHARRVQVGVERNQVNA
jgi:hypothetical protein